MRFILPTLPRGISIFALISLTLLFALAACGGETSTSEQPTPNPEGTSRPSDESTEEPSSSSDQRTPSGTSSQARGVSDGQNTSEDSTAGPTPTPTPLPEFPDEAVEGDYDYDDDGLLEIRTLAQLDAMRLDPGGTGFVDEGRDQYFAAFPGTGGPSGCPNQTCAGYELANNLDFDTNGNGEADEGDDYWNDGMGWETLPGIPEGVTFDGNGYTISNLFITDGLGFFRRNYGKIVHLNLNAVRIHYPGWSDTEGEVGSGGWLAATGGSSTSAPSPELCLVITRGLAEDRGLAGELCLVITRGLAD